MTREEAIALFEKQLTAAQVVLDSGFGSNPGENDFLYRRRKEMAEIALSALRPVSREDVEKVFPGCPACKNGPMKLHIPAFLAMAVCNQHMDHEAFDIELNSKFCLNCGRPLTDEAVQMVMERLEAIQDAD